MCRASLLVVLLLAACAGTGSPSGDGRGATNGTATPAGVRGALPRDVFPLEAPAGLFSTSQRGTVEVRVERRDGGATMWISGEGLNPQRIDWYVEGDSIYCSDGPDRRVEFLRIGAAPGASWESSGRTIRFEGWERVGTPSGSYDAVRISSALSVPPYTEVETWWFASDIGLVKMRVDKADLYSMEMSRVR